MYLLFSNHNDILFLAGKFVINLHKDGQTDNTKPTLIKAILKWHLVLDTSSYKVTIELINIKDPKVVIIHNYIDINIYFFSNFLININIMDKIINAKHIMKIINIINPAFESSVFNENL